LETDDVTTCRVCGTPYHTECIEESGGCVIKDCSKLVRPKPIEITVDAEPHTHLVLSREAVEKAPESTPRRLSNPCLKCGKQLPYGEIYCPDCMPTSDKIDRKKLWPMIVMIGLITIVVGWIAIKLIVPQPTGLTVDLSRTGPQRVGR
jgi:hypothetical protein